MITLTETAAKEVQNVIEQQRKAAEGQDAVLDNPYLRIGVRGGGCGGMGYTLELAQEITEEDESWEHHGVRLTCDSRSHLYLDGTTIDFKDDGQNQGFVFENPNDQGGCCGCDSAGGEGGC